MREAFGKLNSRLAEAPDGIETVKGDTQEAYAVGHFQRNACRIQDFFVQQGNVEARFLPLLLLALAKGGSLLHALYLYNLGALAVGDVVAYFSLIQLFRFPTFVSLFANSQVSSGISSARRILELVNRESNLDQNEKGYSAPLRGEIEFKKVSFAYPERERVLDRLSFSVKPGQTVAIVGQTGAGKIPLFSLH